MFISRKWLHDYTATVIENISEKLVLQFSQWDRLIQGLF